MDSVGRFHLEKRDNKPFQLVYHNPKYQSIPQTQNLIKKPVGNGHFLQSLFICPNARRKKKGWPAPCRSAISPLILTPEYVFPTTRIQKDDDHHVIPLFQCKNIDLDEYRDCYGCYDSNTGNTYYFCDYCDNFFHKECVESPLQIHNPKHPDHFLQLSCIFEHTDPEKAKCLCCGLRLLNLVYHCITCDVLLHPICAMKSIPFVIKQPKRHDHPIYIFPRQSFLICNICGLLRNSFLTYICLECNFVAHEDCIFSPFIIKISRHQHRISYISDLRSKKWSCGVCRKNMKGDYGAYVCDICSDYYVHSRCALRNDVWDGKELESVSAKDDITEDAKPFDLISEGVILYFLHDHHLQLEVNILYDEIKLCQVCVFPICETHFYRCLECEFIIHETCAYTPRRIQHALHPHPLSLESSSVYETLFCCNACNRDGGGFVYNCLIEECLYDLDVRCALISEPFDYKGHEHPLFLALDPDEKPICHICKTICLEKLNCITCDFIICFKCSTLPYITKYKYDKHFLKVMCGVEVCQKDWCEVCELNLQDTCPKVFYWCNECCTTFHVECLFGEDPYIKPGLQFTLNRKKVEILSSNNLSRPICNYCKNPCQGKLFKTNDNIACSVKCGEKLF